MRRLVFGIACAALVTTATVIAASGKPSQPAVATVIAKITDAYGGRAALDSIKTAAEELTLTLQGQPGTSTTTIKAPNKFLNVLVIPSYRINMTTGFDGTSGWIKDSYGNLKALTGDDLTTARCQFENPIYAILHPGQDPPAAAMQPNQTVNGTQYLVLLVSQKGCPSATLYVDPKTYLISRLVDSEQSLDLSDYTSGPSGEKYPKTLVRTTAQGTSTASVTSVSDNIPVDDAIFAMPGTAAASPAGPTVAPAAPSFAPAAPSPQPMAPTSAPTHPPSKSM